MMIDDDACYRAILARDVRFDGLFYTGVRTTGIYCRPVCPAKTPARSSCRFFASAALAEQGGFRPCLRCRPELAPGEAPIDNTRTLARVAAARIEAGALNDGRSLELLAASLAISSRQLRRAMRHELGVSPVELAQTCRLLLAKRLIADTSLPLVQVAYASGFESVRRFNASFRNHYHLTPTTMRRATGGPTSADESVRLLLGYRPPYAWRALLRFLAARAIAGVECVTADAYHRTVEFGRHRGWLSVRQLPEKNQLAVELASSLTPALPQVLVRLRNLFDLDARPDVIAAHLRGDDTLAPHVRRRPGLRVPGAFDGFELSWRAVLGQQVSVRGASTLASRLAERFGEPINTPLPCLNRLAPTPGAIAALQSSAIAAIGLPTARAETLLGLAKAVDRGIVHFEPGVDPSDSERLVTQIAGIGPWTAAYIAMRAHHWPDAFPVGDLGLSKASGLSKRKLIDAAERWRPWRAYAAMHLWDSLNMAKARSNAR
jgi:AraC family transcriptional regulator of adaptative response / DNA-3-methyladenine glycosylase II